jgi:hypothetical protein
MFAVVAVLALLAERTTAAPASCGEAPTDVYKCAAAPINERVDALLSLMTVSEKVAQLLNPIMDVRQCVCVCVCMCVCVCVAWYSQVPMVEHARTCSMQWSPLSSVACSADSAHSIRARAGDAGGGYALIKTGTHSQTHSPTYSTHPPAHRAQTRSSPSTLSASVVLGTFASQGTTSPTCSAQPQHCKTTS